MIIYRHLKKLTNQHDPEVYIKMLEKALNLSSRINGVNFDQVYAFLKGINAFEETNSNTILIPEIKRDDNQINPGVENRSAAG